MSLQPATLGSLYIGPQAAKGTAAVDSDMYGFRANLVDVAPAQMFRNVGQLVGGSLLPGGSIKTAAWAGGGMVMPPPLDENIGFLFHAFAGSASSYASGGGVYQHFFPSGHDSTAPAKYLTALRSVPGAAVIYEQMMDMVMFRLLFGLTPGEFTTLRADMIGRVPTKADVLSGETAAKDETSVPITCKGHFELPDGTELTTATAVTLELVNVVPDLRRVLVLGDYYPVDFPVLGRAITVSFSFLWENSTLYESLYYSGNDWTPIIYSSSFEVEVQSPGNIGSTVHPYKLIFYAQNVDWSCQPVRLAGGDLVEIAMTGTVAETASGNFDWYLCLQNGTANYTWPT